jgi:hypothetical protein
VTTGAVKTGGGRYSANVLGGRAETKGVHDLYTDRWVYQRPLEGVRPLVYIEALRGDLQKWAECLSDVTKQNYTIQDDENAKSKQTATTMTMLQHPLTGVHCDRGPDFRDVADVTTLD